MQYKKHSLKYGVEWEVIRWVYDPQDGRSKPQKLGRTKESYPFLPPPLLLKCTPQERKEVMEWWNTLKAVQERERGVDEPGFFGIAVNRLISSMTKGLVDESGMSRVREKLKDLHEALQSVEAPNP